MNTVTHPEMVAGLCKPGEQILKEMTPQNFAVIGKVISEFVFAGNQLDMAKKQVIYNKDMGLTAATPRVLPNISAHQWHLLHMAIGIAGEATELLQAVRHALVWEQPMDMDNILEELGDIEFYLEGFREGVGMSRDVTLDANISKLSVRYEGLQYSDKAAQLRADKAQSTQPV